MIILKCAAQAGARGRVSYDGVGTVGADGGIFGVLDPLYAGYASCVSGAARAVRTGGGRAMPRCGSARRLLYRVSGVHVAPAGGSGTLRPRMGRAPTDGFSIPGGEGGFPMAYTGGRAWQPFRARIVLGRRVSVFFSAVPPAAGALLPGIRRCNHRWRSSGVVRAFGGSAGFHSRPRWSSAGRGW